MWSRVQTVTSVSGCSGAETHFSLAYLLPASCSYFVKHLDGVTAAAVADGGTAEEQHSSYNRGKKMELGCAHQVGL